MRNGNFAPSGQGKSRRQTGALDEKGPGAGLGQGDKAKMGYGSLEAETCSQRLCGPSPLSEPSELWDVTKLITGTASSK